MAKVGIFGAGWVGLVTGVCFAELGHEVVIRDVVPEKIEALQRGEVPFHEHDVLELLERNRERLTLHARRGRLAGLRVALRLRRHAADAVGRRRPLPRVDASSTSCPTLDGRPMLVMKSTVPVGTGEKVRHGLDARGLAHVGYVSNPEFLAEGNAVRDFMHPDRIVDRRVRARRTATPSRRSTTRSTRRSCAATSTRPR